MKRRRKSSYTTLIIIAGVLVYLFFSHSPYSRILMKGSSPEKRNENIQTADLQNSVKSIIYLYFSNRENTFLAAEESVLVHSTDAVDLGKKIIKALIKGPKGELLRTIPGNTTLNALYITEDGTAFVDFSKELSENHPGGGASEFLTVFSIVNSLALNISTIDRVKILIGGYEADTLAGHVELHNPFKTNMLIVR
jgi:spore germination protein GerM